MSPGRSFYYMNKFAFAFENRLQQLDPKIEQLLKSVMDAPKKKVVVPSSIAALIAQTHNG